MTFEKEIEQHAQLIAKAMAMGGELKLEQRKAQGILNARERISYILDPDSFVESGMFVRSLIPEAQDTTPADGKIAGYGRINGKRVGIIANDFTVKGASSTNLNAKKMSHIKNTATSNGFPMVLLGESSGARMPDIMGAKGMAFALENNMYQRTRETPWANAILGNAFGSSAWYACMSDFNVVRKGSCLAVSSSRLVSLATRAEISTEDLGGWELHAKITGIADVVTDTDMEALDAIKRFLSYMPSHHMTAPPVVAVPEKSDEAIKDILKLVPNERTKVYDVKKVIRTIVDIDSFFELKCDFGKSIVTSLCRIDGKTVGIIANNPLHKGGAIDADACDKVCSFIVLCDSFNIPMVFFVDQPGFLIGIEGEKKKITGKIINWMNAMALSTMPKIAVQFRKNYGQGWLNMGGGKNANEFAAWWMAETSFMDPASAVGVVFGVDRETEKERYDEMLNTMLKDTSAYESAYAYSAKQVIDPRETRDYLKSMLDTHCLDITKGVGKHLMRTWPTTI